MELIEIAEAATRFNCSGRKIIMAIRRGELPGYRPGRKIKVVPADVEEWILTRCRVKPKVTQTGRGRTRQTILNGKVWK